jgi:hypothetical protein
MQFEDIRKYDIEEDLLTCESESCSSFVIFTLYEILFGWLNRKDEIGGKYSTHVGGYKSLHHASWEEWKIGTTYET